MMRISKVFQLKNDGTFLSSYQEETSNHLNWRYDFAITKQKWDVRSHQRISYISPESWSESRLQQNVLYPKES